MRAFALLALFLPPLAGACQPLDSDSGTVQGDDPYEDDHYDHDPYDEPDAGPIYQQPDASTQPTGPTEGTVVAKFCFNNYMRSDTPRVNNGAQQTIRLQEENPRMRGLLGFYLDEIPAGSTVLSATLAIKTQGDGKMDRGAVNLYRATEEWVEGTAQNQPDASNWDNRLTGVKWSSPGAGASSRSSVALGTFQPRNNHTVYNVSLNVSEMQAMLAQNYGFVLAATGGDDDARLYTCDDLDVAAWPALTINYRTP